jgi:hypothetical protein
MTMTRMLVHPIAEVVVIPVLLMLVGVLARRLGRRDGGDDTPRINDAAVCTTMLLMCLTKIVAGLEGAAHQNCEGGVDVIAGLRWLILIMASLFFSVDHDRYRSWKLNARRRPTGIKRPLVGIVLPNSLSLVAFCTYQLERFLS